MILLVAY